MNLETAVEIEPEGLKHSQQILFKTQTRCMQSPAGWTQEFRKTPLPSLRVRVLAIYMRHLG